MAHGSAYECDLVDEMLPALKSDDLLIFDRGYAAFPFMARLVKNKKHFIIRCPKSSFTAVSRWREMIIHGLFRHCEE